MKTTEELKTKISKYFKTETSNVIIKDEEHRENIKGKNLKNGMPIYVLMNTGVDGEQVSEFCGWIIARRWYKENC
jgi:hypothetical protein